MPEITDAKKRSEGRSTRFHFIVASAVYGLDVLFTGLGILSFLVAAVFFVIAVSKTLIRIFKREPFTSTPLLKAGIYSLCFAAAVSTILTNNLIAKGRAEFVVSALKQYKAKYRHYPNTLRELTPEFLPSVPIAKYSLTFNDFRYWRRSGETEGLTADSATLYYVVLPPFGRLTYDFEKDRWNYID